MKKALQRFARGLREHFNARPQAPQAWSKDSPGTRFIDVQRRLNIYLRALWGCDFALQPAAYEFEARAASQPYVQKLGIHLPGSFYDFAPHGSTLATGLDLYRAAAAHAAAHIVYTQQPFPEAAPDKWLRAVISTIEDARVEALAIRRFPGLKQLWTRQHTAAPAPNATALDYLHRLERALLDERYSDDDAWIAQGRALFRAARNLESNGISWDIGTALALAFQDKQLKFNTRAHTLAAPYRDDNRYIWEFSNSVPEDELPPSLATPLRHKGSLEMLVKAEDTDQEPTRIAEQSNAAPENLEGASEPYLYSEWNHLDHLETKSWVTLREIPPVSGDQQLVAGIVAQHRPLLARMKNLLDAIRLEGVRRIRKLEEGDEIDVNAAIRALIDLRQGVQPDTRIMMRSLRKTRDISVLVLLDLSKSTNEKVKGKDYSVLQLTQEVCVLFADAIESIGDPFAIHGFCSFTRHNVKYYRFKDFDQSYGDVPKARLAGMTGQQSTRISAAIRHATYHLNQQHSDKKLLMVITDGAPSDIDVHDPRYLRYDTKKAVEEASRSGISTYCIGLDPDADQYISRIFGSRNYMVVDHVKNLPEKMLLLYAELTR